MSLSAATLMMPRAELLLDRQVHVALRFADSLYDVGDVVDRHRAVIRKHGYVWWGNSEFR